MCCLSLKRAPSTLTHLFGESLKLMIPWFDWIYRMNSTVVNFPLGNHKLSVPLEHDGNPIECVKLGLALQTFQQLHFLCLPIVQQNGQLFVWSFLNKHFLYASICRLHHTFLNCSIIHFGSETFNTSRELK